MPQSDDYGGRSDVQAKTTRPFLCFRTHFSTNSGHFKRNAPKTIETINSIIIT